MWPWIGFGAAIVILILLLFTDVLKGDKRRKKIFDPTWLAWGIAFAYLVHVLEDYGLHVVNGQYELITSFQEMGVDEKFGGLPLVFFPLVNILLTWVALPVAAILSKKHKVIGLSGIGFVLVNALTHIGGAVVLKLGLIRNAGGITGIFLFIPLFILFCYACKKGKIC